ncbi:hypothetical protein V1504DRAFT_458743 [Lipomyces starkeyi]
MRVVRIRGERSRIEEIPADMYLAKLQGTKYPIYPFRTKHERDLYRILASERPQAGSDKRRNIGQSRKAMEVLTREFNSKCDNVTLFYKIPEHLMAHRKPLKPEPTKCSRQWHRGQ